MTAPSLTVYSNGTNQVSGDNLNTFMQTCNVVSDLRGFAGTTGIEVYLRGFTAIGDGGQGVFYWNSNSTAADDAGITTIVPNGSTAGAWTRLNSVTASPYSVQVPTNGFSITIPNGINELILNPAGTLASGTVIMPSLPLDGQIVKIVTEQTITTITISPNTGQTLSNAPSTLTQFAFVEFTYDFPTLTWYRTGSQAAATSLTANALASATTTINVSSATAPSAGQVLTATSGTAAIWQTPSSSTFNLLSSQSASSSASISFSSTFITGTYNTYQLIIEDAVPATLNATLDLYMSTNNGSTFIATLYQHLMEPQSNSNTYTGSGLTAANFMQLSSDTSGAASSCYSGIIMMFGVSTSTNKQIVASGTTREDSTHNYNSFTGGTFIGNSVVNNIKLQFSSGNITSGNFKLYGIS